MIIHAEQRIEQLAAGGKAGSRVGNKKDKNPYCCNEGQNPFFVTIAIGKEFRNGDGVVCLRVTAYPLCHDKPVEIGSGCKPDGSPACVCNTGQIGNSRQAHEEPARHIRGFRTHGRDQRAELSSSEVEIIHRFISI